MSNPLKRFIAIAATAILVFGLLAMAIGCGGSGSVSLTGAGATFPYPLYSKWFDVYSQENPGVTINYQSIGSGGGIQQITAQTVDFGASDAPMKDEELDKAPGELLHIPTVAGAVVVVYNVEGLSTGLKLTSDTLGKIFLGEITKWNDPALAADNPGIDLPDKDIAVIHRSDGSGTTNIFTDYLSSANADWKDQVGKGKEVNWPVGIGGKGNEGVGGQVAQTDGSIGYVELAYATQNQLSMASLKNKSGTFIEPSVDSTTAAMAGAISSLPDDLRGSIVNSDGANAWPIAGLTYLLVYKNQQDEAKGRALVTFIDWAINNGSSYAKDLDYAPLPPELAARVKTKLAEINYQGTSLAS
jgi:phosphate transport system substrate-binding protein